MAQASNQYNLPGIIEPIKKIIMRKIIYLAAICCCYCIITGYSTGAGKQGYELTGAENGFGNATNGGCSCHSPSATIDIGVAIELDSSGIPTTHYKGGMIYSVKLKGINKGTTLLPKFGFQISSIAGSNTTAAPTNAGTWNTPYPANTHYSAPQATFYDAGIVEQSIALPATTGTGGNGSTYEQTFNWKAPASGTGTISIWAILNAVNGDGYSGAEDKWDTSHAVIREWPMSVSVPFLEPDNFSIHIFPNPVTTNMNLTYLLDEMSIVTLKLLDLNGRAVANLLNETEYPGMQQVHLPIPTKLSEGVYILKADVKNKQYLKKIIVSHW